MKTYKLTLHCSNCGHEEIMEIGRGLRYTEVPCSNCGCYDLSKTESMEDKMAKIYKV